MTDYANRYYDRSGKPITGAQFRALKASQYRIALDTIGTSTVSTVWLGLDHAYGDGSPIIFETLVRSGPLSDEMERYSTEAEARAGHERMCERVRDAELGHGAQL